MRYEELLDEMAGSGALTPRWRPVFDKAPRRHFVPPQLWGQRDRRWRRIDQGRHPARWYSLVHSDESVVTQLDGGDRGGAGRVTACGIQPSTVARQLAHLDLRPGMRVLEIGTGWTTALLCEMTGARNVTSVEINQQTLDIHRALLDARGYRPEILRADGLREAVGRAPFDRILVTCALHDVPWTLIGRSGPGGLVSLPFRSCGLITLTVADDRQSAAGTFHAPAFFPWAYGHRPASQLSIAGGERPRTSAAVVDPVLLAGSRGAQAYVGLVKSPLRMEEIVREELFEQGTVDHVRLHDAAASRAVVFSTAPHVVYQWGPRSLWDEVEEALDRWRKHGSPGLPDLGLEITRNGLRAVNHRAPGDSWTLSAPTGSPASPRPRASSRSTRGQALRTSRRG
ncbi:hypothetical protein ACIBK8_33105 [Streptomyces sp. NPDC050161]|uniref:hypothetical protein n=1 Tax=Streptomyces sp. NPDC050161 TaxID=3365604 RepID=UPI0037A931A4